MASKDTTDASIDPRNIYKVNLQISACPVGDDDTEVYYKVRKRSPFPL